MGKAKIIKGKGMRVIGILRVSQTKERKKDEDLHSPATQLARIKEECKRLGYVLVAVFEELDVSGRKLPLSKRTKGLLPAIEMIEHHEADILMVAYMDRVIRQLKVQMEIVDRVEKAGGEVLTLDHGQLTDKEPAKKLMGRILGAFHEYQVDSYAERAADGVRDGVERGVQVGPPPHGYKIGVNLMGEPRGLVADWDSGIPELLLRGWELADTGATLYRQVRQLWEDGGLFVTTPGRTLHNVTYKGWMHWGDLIVPNTHEAIIPPALFDRVMARVVPKGSYSSKSNELYLLANQGVVLCDQCKGRMPVTTGVDGFPSYRCGNRFNCPHPVSISVRRVDEHVWACVVEELKDGRGQTSHQIDAQVALANLRTAQEHKTAFKQRLSKLGIDEDDTDLEGSWEELAREEEQARRIYDLFKGKGSFNNRQFTVEQANTNARKLAFVHDLGTRCYIKPPANPGRRTTPGRTKERMRVVFTNRLK